LVRPAHLLRDERHVHESGGHCRPLCGREVQKWGKQYGAMIRLWRRAWEEFIPFLDYDVEIRRMICSTNAIESLNARYRRAVRARGHFPTEQAALKCLYLVIRRLDPTGAGHARWHVRWKPVINAFAITFGDRWPDVGTY
jgi:putative transposase